MADGRVSDGGVSMRAAVVNPDEAKFEVRDMARPVPGSEEVLVKIAATAVNRADTLQRRGLYAPPPILGLECSGVVESVGDGVVSLKPGDKVMGLLSGGGYGEFVAAPAAHFLPVPSSTSLPTAAGIPETFLTAYQLLFLLARVQEGEVVLVHAAGSGVGTAALQMIRAKGALAVAVAGSEEKLEKARELGAIATINYKETPEWAGVVQGRVREATEGRKEGVDVILDCVGESFASNNVQAVNQDGRWIIFGLMGGKEPPAGLLGSILRKRLTLIGTTLRTRSNEYKADLIARFAADFLESLEKGDIAPIISATLHGLDALNEAHALVESNKTLGKVIVSLEE